MLQENLKQTYEGADSRRGRLRALPILTLCHQRGR